MPSLVEALVALVQQQRWAHSSPRIWKDQGLEAVVIVMVGVVGLLVFALIGVQARAKTEDEDKKPAVAGASPQRIQLSHLHKSPFADPAGTAASVSSHTDTHSFSKCHIPSLQQLTAASASCPEPRSAPTSTSAAHGSGLHGLHRGSLSGREGLMETGGSGDFDLAAIHRVFSSVDPGHVAGTQALLDSCGWDVGQLLRWEMEALN